MQAHMLLHMRASAPGPAWLCLNNPPKRLMKVADQSAGDCCLVTHRKRLASKRANNSIITLTANSAIRAPLHYLKKLSASCLAGVLGTSLSGQVRALVGVCCVVACLMKAGNTYSTRPSAQLPRTPLPTLASRPSGDHHST